MAEYEYEAEGQEEESGDEMKPREVAEQIIDDLVDDGHIECSVDGGEPAIDALKQP